MSEVSCLLYRSFFHDTSNEISFRQFYSVFPTHSHAFFVKHLRKKREIRILREKFRRKLDEICHIVPSDGGDATRHGKVNGFLKAVQFNLIFWPVQLITTFAGLINNVES